MDDGGITATFGPPPGDRTTLSKPSRATLDALYRHPLAHNLEWSDVEALFGKLGTVDHKPNNEMAFGIAGEHHRFRKPHTKDLTAEEVMTFRHMLTRAGWAPGPTPAPASVPGTDAPDTPEQSGPPDLLAVVDHHEARLYHLDFRSADPVDQVIRPYDPHHVLNHLSHKDHPRERGQRSPEDQGFYEHIAQAIAPGRMAVLVGHGKGHSNAAHHLAEHLRLHHPDIFRKVVCEVAADLSSLTTPQLLVLGRRALTTSRPDNG